MIIEISDTLINASNPIAAETAVEAVGQSVARGEHLLIASRTALSHFVANTNLSQRTRGLIQSTLGNYTFIAGLAKQVEMRVRIVDSQSAFSLVQPNVWEVSATHIANNGVRPTVLLCENSADGSHYYQAARHYASCKGVTNLHIYVEVRNGNGSGISQELAIVENRRSEFCLCITDSDRLFPGAALGVNSAACEGVRRSSQWVLRHYATQGRELENEFPTTIVDDACSNLASFSSFANALATAPQVMPFCDMKHGTSVCWVRSQPANGPSRTFWDSSAMQLVGTNSSNFNCSRQGGCLKSECKNMVVPAVSARMAEMVAEHMATRTIHKIIERAKGAVNFGNWLEIGEAVFDCGIAVARQRV